MAHLERVIVLVDMDCFYCQVEERINPNLKEKPVAVVQYNAWQGGGIIAVNYIARDKGVTRMMRGSEAQKHCPDIVLCSVPCVRGKADLTKYRDAGKEVVDVLKKFTAVLQRASIDEAYLDLTEAVNKRITKIDKEILPQDIPNTFIYGSDKEEFLYDLYNNSTDDANLKLIVGGLIMEEVRAAVYKETGFRCSAGIAHNKILAKLACGFHKPNKQTILPHCNVRTLYKELPIKKIKSLGGKFGETVADDLNIKYMAELEQFSEKLLQQKYDTKNGTWLYNIARGIDMEPVTIRLCPKSIGCCKRFPGRSSLKTPDEVHHWLSELAEEISERLNQELEENNRRATQMIIHYTMNINKQNSPSTKSRNLTSYDSKKIADDAFEVINKVNSVRDGKYYYPIVYLGIISGKFEEAHKKIQSFFSKQVTSKKDSEVVIPTCSSDNNSNETSTALINQSNIKTQQCKDDVEISSNHSDIIHTERSCPEQREKLSMINKHSLPQHDHDTNMDIDRKEVLSNPIGPFFLEQKTVLNNDVACNLNENSNSKTICDPTDLIDSEDLMELCADCNKRIPLLEFPSHADYHLALKIAAFENNSVHENSRNSSDASVMASNIIVVPKQTTKKPLIKSKNTTKSIVDFLKKTDLKDVGETEICNICKQSISLVEFLDHLDYHAAKELHRQLNSNVVKAKEVTNEKSVKRKTTDAIKNEPSVKRKSNEKVNDKNKQSITNFFKSS